jgi:hypothetical protein
MATPTPCSALIVPPQSAARRIGSRTFASLERPTGRRSVDCCFRLRLSRKSTTMAGCVAPARDVPICRNFRRWRDPDSNRGHHDCQGVVAEKLRREKTCNAAFRLWRDLARWRWIRVVPRGLGTSPGSRSPNELRPPRPRGPVRRSAVGRVEPAGSPTTVKPTTNVELALCDARVHDRIRASYR